MTIFPSTLIISTNPDTLTIIDQLHTGQPDLLVIDPPHSIDQIRQIKNFFSQKPFSHPNKLAIIHQTEDLNLESQNALLKILEEPGPDNYLVLTTATPSALLPTIISRCHQIKQQITPPPQKISLAILPNLQQNLIQSDKISSDRTQVLPYLQDQLLAYQQQLVKNPTPATAKMIRKIIRAIKMISANVDPRSALDYLLLS